MNIVQLRLLQFFFQFFRQCVYCLLVRIAILLHFSSFLMPQMTGAGVILVVFRFYQCFHQIAAGGITLSENILLFQVKFIDRVEHMI